MRISSSQFLQQGINAIIDQQNEVGKVQLQLATGKRVLTPSDDPVSATQILGFNQELARTNQLQQNADFATSRLQLEETTIKATEEVYLRVRELVLQGMNGTVPEESLNALRIEVELRLQELIGLANTRDGTGDYIFSGFEGKTQPFARDSTGQLIYSGDQGQRYVQVGTSVQVPVSDSGFELFQSIKQGNGDFVAADNANNTGTGVIDPGSVVNNTLFAANRDTYNIAFTVDAQNNTSFTVTNTNTATATSAAGALTAAGGLSVIDSGDLIIDGVTVGAGAADGVSPSVTTITATGHNDNQNSAISLSNAINAANILGIQTEIVPTSLNLGAFTASVPSTTAWTANDLVINNVQVSSLDGGGGTGVFNNITELAAAINTATATTGVTADGTSGELILTAADGRNIQVETDATAPAGADLANFALNAQKEQVQKAALLVHHIGTAPMTIAGAAPTDAGLTAGTVNSTASSITIQSATPYVDGEAINFNGIITTISGEPSNGDTFTITPSTSQSLFSTLENIITALSETTHTKRVNQLNRALVNVDQAFERSTEVRSRIGARLNTIEVEKEVNGSFLLFTEQNLSALQDLDFAQAASDLARKTLALQAAQQSFVRIQNLSLFNFL